MSFELTVLAVDLPSTVVEDWRLALSRFGLAVEFPPGFSLDDHRGGHVPLRLAVATDAFPGAADYGSDPLLAGFEFDTRVPPDRAGYPDAPSELVPRVAASAVEFIFRTAMGRSVADLRIQCFAAATLAIITRGLLFDPQCGAYYCDGDATAFASSESDAYDAYESGRGRFAVYPFPSWPQ